MSLLRHLFGISSKISNSSKYPKTPKMLIFRVFHIPLKYPLKYPYFDPLRNTPKIPFSKKHHFFWKSQKPHFSKNTIFYIFGKTWYFGFFHFLQKRYFFVFLLFLSFSSFSKKWGNAGFLCFLVFSQNVHFYKISFFYTIVKKGGFRNMWDLIKIDVFSMCVFRYGIPRCDMGTPRWNRYRELESILWSWYCTHTLWGGNFWWLWRRCGDGVILGTRLSCGLGYPGDGIISLIGKIGLSGGWRRLVMVTTWGIHVICWNMNEHGYFLMFSVDGVMKYTYKPSM